MRIMLKTPDCLDVLQSDLEKKNLRSLREKDPHHVHDHTYQASRAIDFDSASNASASNASTATTVTVDAEETNQVHGTTTRRQWTELVAKPKAEETDPLAMRSLNYQIKSSQAVAVTLSHMTRALSQSVLRQNSSPNTYVCLVAIYWLGHYIACSRDRVVVNLFISITLVICVW